MGRTGPLARLFCTFAALTCVSEAETDDSCAPGDATCSAGGLVSGVSHASSLEASTAALEASMAAANRTRQRRDVPMQDLITQEMEELQGYISLCKGRIDLLKELKATMSSAGDAPLPASHVRALTEQMPLLSDVIYDVDKTPSGTAGDYLISKRVLPQGGSVKYIKFLPLRNQRHSSSPGSTAQMVLPSTLLVAGQVDGSVRLFSPSGEMVQSFLAGHATEMTSLAVSPSHDEYFVVTGDATGVIRVHKVSMRQRRLTKEQKSSRRSSIDGKISTYLGSQINVTTQFLKEMQVPPLLDGEESPRITTLAVSSNQGSKFFVAGDEQGQISVFTRNGTLRGRFGAGNSPGAVEALHSQLGTLVFRTKNEWGFVNVEKLDSQAIECPGFDTTMVASAIDSQMSARLLVSDPEGSVWVLNTKDKKNCKVEHKFPKGATRAVQDMGSVRGFALALERSVSTGNSSIVALNMSHVAVANHPASPVVWRKELPALRDWAVYKRYQQGDLIATLSEDGLEIEMFELLMTVYQAPVADSFGNFKLPVIAVAIVLVLGYQYMKQKGRFGGGGGGGSSSGGGLGALAGLGGGRGKHNFDSDFLRNRKRSPFASLGHRKKFGR